MSTLRQHTNTTPLIRRRSSSLEGTERVECPKGQLTPILNLISIRSTILVHSVDALLELKAALY